jgi:endonuclease YncB( thermonuclease family)
MESLFNETLVRHGYAVVDEANPDPLFHDQLMQAQDQAQNESLGVWGTC